MLHYKKNQLNIKGDSNTGNEGQNIRRIENKQQNDRHPFLSVITLNLKGSNSPSKDRWAKWVLIKRPKHMLSM